MKELICICCPRGCHLQVDEAQDYAVTGNACPRGAVHGKSECLAPTRMVTSTVVVQGADGPRCPVKTAQPIPKKDIFAVMRALDGVAVKAPVKTGQVIVQDAAGTGVDIVATRSLPAKEQ